MAAGHIAKKLGFHNFDMKAVRKFALTNLQRMRDQRSSYRQTSADLVSRYLTEYHDGIISTKYYPKAKPTQNQIEQAFNRGAIVGRIAHQDKKIYLLAEPLMTWLADRGISAINTFEDLYRHRHLKTKKAVKPNPSIRDYQQCITLGKGTDITTGQTWCIELAYDKTTTGGAALAAVTTQQGANDESN